MSTPKQSRRKGGVNKLEPIDWHEFANDAVLNGNMSTLYHRPATEDPTMYASPEALREIEKRVGRPAETAVVVDVGPGPVTADGLTIPTVGTAPTVGRRGRSSDETFDVDTGQHKPTVGSMPTVGMTAEPGSDDVSPTGCVIPTVGSLPAVGIRPTVGLLPTVGSNEPVAADWSDQSAQLKATSTAVSMPIPTVGSPPSAGLRRTVGLDSKRKVKQIRDVQDALTLAGQVLYKAMYGAPDGAKSKSCTKGYRQLAADTHLDKDTVRDLISEFKDKGIVRETGTYDPDTRSAKTYEVLSYKAILQMWRDGGIVFVTTGRQRPTFCTPQGESLSFKPTVGPGPVAIRRKPTQEGIPTVGMIATASRSSGPGRPEMTDAELLSTVIQALQQITGGPVDQEAADRLIRNCRAAAIDCTIEEIVEFAWSKAFLCRSGKIDNPIGFLITQVPKHFQGEALQAYRQKKHKELEVAAEIAAREEEQRRQAELELVALEKRQRIRTEIAEHHRKEQGIDLKALLQDSEADDALIEWAKRMLKLGHRYQPRYD